jgi:hypothetical protein
MKTITLDLDALPTDFARTVAIPDALTGHALRVTFTFRWRDQIDGAALFDRYLAEARKLLSDAQSGEKPADSAEEVRAAIARDIGKMHDMATGWNIAAPFDDAHLTKFFTRYPGASLAIISDYRSAIMTGE